MEQSEIKRILERGAKGAASAERALKEQESRGQGFNWIHFDRPVVLDMRHLGGVYDIQQ